ncbi:hypothetical protein ABPG74_021273 [Tetrahymena malaccensis]
MNTLLCQIQSLKSEHGTQKTQKDGNLTSFLPGKWNSIGDLNKEYVFYIAKKYKSIVRKVAKNIKSSRSIEASSNQNSNPISKINFLKSLDNLDAGDNNKENSLMETKSDTVAQNNLPPNPQDNSATKPKMFGKNFKPKNSSIDVNKNLHSKFKTPSVATEKPADVAQKMEVEKTDTKNSDKKNEKKLESEPIITLKVPSSPQVISSKAKETEQNKSKLKENKQANQVAEAKQSDETNVKQIDEVKGKQQGKSRKNQNKKKGSQELDLSLDLSLDMSDEEKKQSNTKQQMIDEKEIVKIASTDDEDEEDRALQKKQANKNQMNKEIESTNKTDTKTTAKSNNKEKQPNKKAASKDSKQQSDDEKQQKGSLLNKKRKAEENKDSKLMDIEEEQEQAENQKKDIQTKNQQMKENAQKKGSLKPSLASNAIGNKKRKTDQVEGEKDNKMVQDAAVMKDELQKTKTNNQKKDDKQKDKKQNDNVMEDENQLKKNQENKNQKNKQPPQTKDKDDQSTLNNQKSKKEISKIESSKEQKKGNQESATKSAKTSLAAVKKADKKKQVLKNQEKRNSLVKQNIENEQEESEDEQSYVINSDGEEEFVLKGNKNSIKSAIKPSSKKYNVIFSNCILDETDVQNRLSKLGARIMKSIQQPFNILIMDEFTRRAKTLVALNKGAKIISSQWVLDCICQEHLIEDIDKYEIKVDKAFCKKHKFDLKEVQQRHQNQNKPIFQDIKFILPDDENYANIAKDDLEYIIMTAGGSIVTEEECDDIENKSNIKVIFDNEKSEESHTTPEKNQSKSKLSESKKKNQDETRVKLQYSYKKNNFDCVLIESIFNSCLHQKVCNWNDFQV